MKQYPFDPEKNVTELDFPENSHVFKANYDNKTIILEVNLDLINELTPNLSKEQQQKLVVGFMKSIYSIQIKKH
jgi:hypothetical protein